MLEEECLSMDSDKIMENFAAPSFVTYTKKMKMKNIMTTMHGTKVIKKTVFSYSFNNIRL